MGEPCRDCGQHNEYGQRIASHEVRIDDMRGTIREFREKFREIWERMDRFCTKKAFYFLLTCLITTFISVMGLNLSLYKEITTVTSKVEAIQTYLESSPWK